MMMNEAGSPFADRRAIFDAMIDRAAALGPTPYAVVWPCETHALAGAIQAAQRGVMAPVLIGDRGLMTQAARDAGCDIASYEIIEADTPENAVQKAIGLVHVGKVYGLAKGSLHTDTLMHGVVAEQSGLRTGRRMSHVFMVTVAGREKPLFVTDAAINIAPDLLTKQHIVQNAIDLYQGLGGGTPRIALLSAIETINPKIQGTLDAACLCKMADRGEITGALLDGPLALDGAVDPQAALIKGLTSPVAGHADILVVPALEAGNMVVKALSFLGRACSGGIVLGAKIPVMLTSRADSVGARLDSAALCALYARSLNG